MKTLLTYICNFLGTVNPAFASITLATVSLMSVFSWMTQQWTALIAKIDTLAQQSFAGTITFEPIALMNTFMPLTEILNFTVAWLQVLLVCTAIRVIKSFIPAIAT